MIKYRPIGINNNILAKSHTKKNISYFDLFADIFCILKHLQIPFFFCLKN